ncbi:hypothetical protein C7999DRAFT_33700 [Corynascus novoguineensis]|uniref:Uncharacterized protein n=1 Tax=Corynascus novoguineensis TaxID=1126955 RepID=A0AAN7CR78_9PEZI|nr:hypothetical protein C7999DRAFT_33700 [Corynascus novoguineensis]
MLLLPLVRLMDRHFPASRTTSLRSFYQDLQAVVAQAGYLSLGISWSRSVFRFLSPFPGVVRDLDQIHVDDRIYKASEAANKRADAAAERKWKRERAQRRTARGARTGVAPPGARTGKVQIALWPMLQRFPTVGEVDPATGTADGKNTTTLSRSRVVYYCGWVDKTGGAMDKYPSLSQWVRQARSRRRTWTALLSPLRWAVCSAGLWLLLTFWNDACNCSDCQCDRSNRKGRRRRAAGPFEESDSKFLDQDKPAKDAEFDASITNLDPGGCCDGDRPADDKSEGGLSDE